MDARFAVARERATLATGLAASARPVRELAWQAAQIEAQQRAVEVLTGRAARADGMRGLGPRERAALADLLGQTLGSGAMLELKIVPTEAP
jgi:hypothetical protein